MAGKVITPKDYADSYRAGLLAGKTLEELNKANHIAFEKKMISFEHFIAAANVLKEEVLRR